jgi:DNA-binding YbaB/EbfC family protein
MAKGLGNIMRQAQQMQEKMLKMQEEMAQRTVTGSAGGGMVTVEANGKHEILSIKIEPDVLQGEDAEMLEDLIVAAVNEALRKVQEMLSAEMNKLTGGISIPGLP